MLLAELAYHAYPSGQVPAPPPPIASCVLTDNSIQMVEQNFTLLATPCGVWHPPAFPDCVPSVLPEDAFDGKVAAIIMPKALKQPTCKQVHTVCWHHEQTHLDMLQIKETSLQMLAAHMYIKVCRATPCFGQV